MPTYEYVCEKCDHEFEIFQSIKADPLKDCPKCKGKVRRMIGTGAGIIFKGSGFYETDYRSESYKSGAKKESDSKKSSSKSDSKSKSGNKSNSSISCRYQSVNQQNNQHRPQTQSKRPTRSRLAIQLPDTFAGKQKHCQQ
ncbi:MAG: hypothetical protein CMO71_04230 [Verrucomicrobiales bacterium]|nr:hypothetical protein [Verrucomicrobiales bacterium]